ncbi:hypothetical protein ACPC5Q_08935 [Acinetobacter junii]|uniref:hypothetical protein n=1 Tax=Acinetobacter junii TaxID=40215 RepID=UPI003C236A9F
MRSEFEKAYKPNPHKSPFTEVRFNEEKQIYEPLNPPLDRVARSLNAAWYGYRIRQTEVDELQRRNQMLNDNIKEQGQKLVYQNEVIETQAEKLLGLRDEKAELQKRVDEQTRHIEMALLAVKDIHKSAIDEFHDWDVINEKAPKLCEHLQNLSVAVGELEQALKGGEA